MQEKEIIAPIFEKGDVITRISRFAHDYGYEFKILSVNKTTGRYILPDGHELDIEHQNLYRKVDEQESQMRRKMRRVR